MLAAGASGWTAVQKPHQQLVLCLGHDECSLQIAVELKRHASQMWVVQEQHSDGLAALHQPAPAAGAATDQVV